MAVRVAKHHISGHYFFSTEIAIELPAFIKIATEKSVLITLRLGDAVYYIASLITLPFGDAVNYIASLITLPLGDAVYYIASLITLPLGDAVYYIASC